MIRGSGLAVAVAVAASWNAAFAQRASDWRPPKGMIEIVGRTDPAGIPDYLVWRSAFRTLGRSDRDRDGPSPFLYTIQVPDDQRALILATAIRSAGAEEATWGRQRARLAEMQQAGQDGTAIKKALYDIDYAQRLSTLAERDALLKTLTLEARAVFKAWVEDVRRSTSAVVPVADLEAYRQPAVAPLTHFAFHSNLWLDLHYFLRASARGAPVPTGLSAEEARQWEAGVAFYKRYADRDLLRDDGMVEIKTALRAAEGKFTLDGVVVDAGVKGTLERLMPIYKEHWAGEHDRGNRTWIAEVQLLLERHEAALVQAFARTYESTWPGEPIPVDVSVTAGPNGAYTTGPPTHVTISSSDEGLQGFAALEMLFHESSHSALSELFTRVRQAAEAQQVAVPPQLWHAVLFYTAGELTRRELESQGVAYREYADQRLYTNLCGTGCRERIVEHWAPRLDGRRSVADALAALVAAFKER
jgi:hypothetical protein